MRGEEPGRPRGRGGGGAHLLPKAGEDQLWFLSFFSQWGLGWGRRAASLSESRVLGRKGLNHRVWRTPWKGVGAECRKASRPVSDLGREGGEPRADCSVDFPEKGQSRASPNMCSGHTALAPHLPCGCRAAQADLWWWLLTDLAG